MIKDSLIRDVDKISGKIINTYQIQSLIGKGGFALCYHVVQLETGKSFCAKVVRKSTLEPKVIVKLKSEVKIHSQLRHGNIVKLIKFFEDDVSIYLLLELCSSVSLAELHKQRKRFTESEVRYLVYQVIQGVKYIHSQNVIHRDLKLGNLLLDGHKVKIADFGLATQLQFAGERRQTICGTPNYIAPEILAKGKDSSGHSFEVDIWAIGIVLYTLIVGSPPFETQNVASTYKKIQSLSYVFPNTVEVSQGMQELIAKILQIQPEKRPTLQEVERALIDLQFANIAEVPSTLFAQRENRREEEKIQLPPPMPATHTRPASDRPPLAPEEQRPAKVKKPNPEIRRPNPSPNRSASNTPAITRVDHTAVPSNGTVNLSKRVQPANAHERGPAVGLAVIVEYIRHEQYGWVFKLNTGSVVVLFNDQTKMIWHKNTGKIEYVDKGKRPNGATIEATSLPTTDAHAKKLELLRYFDSQLTSGKRVVTAVNNFRDTVGGGEVGSVYVRSSFETPQAVICRFSDSHYQAIFKDKMNFLISNSSPSATVIHPNGSTSIVNLSDEYQREPFIRERITHIYSVLEKMWAEGKTFGLSRHHTA